MKAEVNFFEGGRNAFQTDLKKSGWMLELDSWDWVYFFSAGLQDMLNGKRNKEGGNKTDFVKGYTAEGWKFYDEQILGNTADVPQTTQPVMEQVIH